MNQLEHTDITTDRKPNVCDVMIDILSSLVNANSPSGKRKILNQTVKRRLTGAKLRLDVLQFHRRYHTFQHDNGRCLVASVCSY